MGCANDKNEASCSNKSNLAYHEYDATYARKVWGFKPIPCSSKLLENNSKLQKITKKAVNHNFETLKNLPSEIKLPIIRKCIKNRSNDFVGLSYIELYDPCRFKSQDNHMVKQDTKRVCKKRVRVDDEEYEDEDYEEEEKKTTQPKKKKKTENVVVKSEPIQKAAQKVLKPAPNLPEEIKERIEELNGTDIKWVMTKTLCDSDVAPSGNRLSMPLKQIDNSFLKDEEEEFLSKVHENEKNRPGISVKLVGHTGNQWTVMLKRWKMNKDNGRRIPYAVALKHSNGACAALLNPSSAEPLVWPSPLKFISELNMEAKVLLERDLMDANREREKAILKGTGYSVDSPLHSDGGVDDNISEEQKHKLSPPNSQVSKLLKVMVVCSL